jgi:proteasome lid subunit RPN8/RPN11
MPREAVGLLAGADGLASRQIALPNVLGEKHFLADPYAQFRALSQLSAEGLTLLAVYHSHPGGGVQLSALDLAFARRLPYLQLVIAIGRANRPAPEIAAYAMAGSSVQPVTIELVSDAEW